MNEFFYSIIDFHIEIDIELVTDPSTPIDAISSFGTMPTRP
jgi:hypothetical protein